MPLAGAIQRNHMERPPSTPLWNFSLGSREAFELFPRMTPLIPFNGMGA
jgi:hypothetical protein